MIKLILRELHPLNQLEVTEKHMMKNIKTGEKVIIMLRIQITNCYYYEDNIPK